MKFILAIQYEILLLFQKPWKKIWNDKFYVTAKVQDHVWGEWKRQSQSKLTFHGLRSICHIYFIALALTLKKDILVNMLKKEKKRAQDAISELESFGQLPLQSSSTSESSMANSRSNSRNQLSPDKSQKLSKSEEKAKQTICKDSIAVLVHRYYYFFLREMDKSCWFWNQI